MPTNPAPASPHSTFATIITALMLLAAACTASTTIDSVGSVPQATKSAESPDLAEPTGAPVAEPTPATEANDTDTPTPAPAEAPEVADDAATSADATADTTQVVLLDAGAEPRVELRFMIAASCGETMTIDQTQELTQTVDDFDLPSAGAVGTVVEMSNSASRVGDNYETQSVVTAAYASSGVAAEVAANMNAELARMVGLASFVTITDRGVQVPGTYRVEGAEALGPLQSAVEAISQVQAPLPVEAVGVGARWETTSVVDFEGAELMTVTEYLITDLDGTLVDLQVSATQTVEVGSRMNMQGFDVEITEWTGITTGETLMDLATISPIRSVSSTRAMQGLDLGAEGLLLQEIASEVTVFSEPDAGCTGRTTRP